MWRWYSQTTQVHHLFHCALAWVFPAIRHITKLIDPNIFNFITRLLRSIWCLITQVTTPLLLPDNRGLTYKASDQTTSDYKHKPNSTNQKNWTLWNQTVQFHLHHNKRRWRVKQYFSPSLSCDIQVNSLALLLCFREIKWILKIT